MGIMHHEEICTPRYATNFKFCRSDSLSIAESSLPKQVSQDIRLLSCRTDLCPTLRVHCATVNLRCAVAPAFRTVHSHTPTCIFCPLPAEQLLQADLPTHWHFSLTIIY